MSVSQYTVELSVFVTLLLPTVVSFVGGEVDYSHDPFGDHFIRFFILGILLCLPVTIIVDSYYGDINSVSALVGVSTWFGIGVLIYWVTYRAGRSMRRLVGS